MSKAVELVNAAALANPELLEVVFHKMKQVGGENGLGHRLVQALVEDASGIEAIDEADDADEPVPYSVTAVDDVDGSRESEVMQAADFLRTLDDEQRAALVAILRG